MGPSYDCASSILLCAEDNESILDFEEGEEDEQQSRHANSLVVEPKSCDFYGDFQVDLPLQSDECILLLVERESEHLPREDYAERLRSGALDLSIRKDAIDWISKVHAFFNFGPLSAYLAVNYLDRFLSAYQLPQGKSWMTQLLSVACLSLAAKMEETEVPQSLDLQMNKVAEAKYVFESRTIQRMELLVLTTLKWRMQAVTPFSLIDFFLHKLNGGDTPTKSSISRSVELILTTMKGVEFLAFRPSEIAAAIAMSVLGETQVVDVEEAMTCCIHVSKEGVLRCYEVIQEMVLMRNKSRSAVPQSPIGVLEASCLSYASDELTVGSHAASSSSSSSSHQTTPASKRRRFDRTSIFS